MSNPMRGEADFGPDRKLVVNFNAWCAAEAATGLKTPELIRLMSSNGLSFGELRALIRAFLDKPLSTDEVGDLIDEIGLMESLAALGLAVDAFFPVEKKPRPREAA